MRKILAISALILIALSSALVFAADDDYNIIPDGYHIKNSTDDYVLLIFKNLNIASEFNFYIHLIFLSIANCYRPIAPRNLLSTLAAPVLLPIISLSSPNTGPNFSLT